MNVVVVEHGHYEKADGKSVFINRGAKGVVPDNSPIYGRRLVYIAGVGNVLMNEDDYVRRTAVTVNR